MGDRCHATGGSSCCCCCPWWMLRYCFLYTVGILLRTFSLSAVPTERSTPERALCIDQKSQLFRPLINNDNYRNEAGVNGLVLNLLRRDLHVRRDLAVINESMRYILYYYIGYIINSSSKLSCRYKYIIGHCSPVYWTLRVCIMQGSRFYV